MAEEPDIVEIYADEKGDLYFHIPASMTYLKLNYEEIDPKLVAKHKFVTQITIN